MEENNIKKEGSSFGWGVLGFFFPIVGLILFLVWLKNRKSAAKASGIGALIGFILSIILTIAFFAGFMGMITSIGLYKENGLNPINSNSVEDKKKDDINSKKEEIENTEIDSKSDECNTVATKIEGDYLYEFTPNGQCKDSNVFDENNKELFNLKYEPKETHVINTGEKLTYVENKFYKVDNSIVLYSATCSPGLCYVYVYNSNDKTGFRITSSLEKDDLMVPYIGRDIIIDENKNLVLEIKINQSAGFEEHRDDPRVKIINKIRSCEVSNLESELKENSLDKFAISKKYTYKNENGNIINNPKVEIKETIEDLYNSYATVCSKNSN